MTVIKRAKKGGNHDDVFPSQKKATSSKNEGWGISCIEGAENLALFSNYEIRQNYYNKKKNYDLANDIIDIRDVEKICSPLGLEMSSFPATMQNYPLANPKIKLLVGEEMKRPFEFRARSTNPNTVNTREEERKKLVLEHFMQSAQEGVTEEEFAIKQQEVEKYFKYSYQDISEKMSSDILNYFFREQELKSKFSRGFEDALIAGEEIYRVDIVSGRPSVTKCNPLNIFTYGTGESPYIDDADVIIEDSYNSVGAVIDEFYDVLRPEDIDWLENEKKGSGTGKRGTGDSLNYKNFFPQLQTSTFTAEPITVDNSQSRNRFGGYWDEAGNIRVTRVVWKSRRKVGKLTYFDRFGDQQETIVDENYKIDKTIGEEIKWLWVNEYWEGTRIGEDIYVKIQPRPIQFRSLSHLSECKSGYVGTAYNINTSRSRSLYDQMKPYQYLYNIFMYRTELAFAKYKGPIMEINAGMIPDDWELEEWMYYAEVMGYALMDPFNESKKGSSQGTLAGSMNTVGGKILSDDSIGNYIQSNIQMLNYLEKQMGSISGVSEQRQGQIETRELVGNVERAVSQSSHITEPWFQTHDHVKVRVLECLLETAKYCFKEETDMRLQYVLDDMSTSVLKVDGKLLNESSYSIFVNNAQKDQEFDQALKQLAQAGLQNDKLNFGDLIKVFQANNMTDRAKIIEEAESRKAKELEQAQQAQREHEQKMQQAQAESAEKMKEWELQNREDEQAHKLDEIRAKGEEDRSSLILQTQLASQGEIDKVFMEEAKLASQERLKDKELKMKENESKQMIRMKEGEMKNKMALEQKKIDSKIQLERAKAAQERNLKSTEQAKDLALEEKMKKAELALKEKITRLDLEIAKKESDAKMKLEERVAVEELKIEKQRAERELEHMEKVEEIKLNTEREKSKMKIAEAKAKPKSTPNQNK